MKTFQQIVTAEVKGQKLAAWQNVLCYILSASKDSAATHARSLLEKRLQYIDAHVLQPLGNDFSKMEESLVEVSFLDSVSRVHFFQLLVCFWFCFGFIFLVSLRFCLPTTLFSSPVRLLTGSAGQGFPGEVAADGARARGNKREARKSRQQRRTSGGCACAYEQERWPGGRVAHSTAGSAASDAGSI